MESEINHVGLYNKYNITKANGQPIQEGSEYFVLRLDEYGDPIHIKACRKAILVYANEIKDHLPVLSNELIQKYS